MKKVEWFDINGERVAMKRDRFGWRTVAPMRNEDGSFNLFNTLTGGWRNLIFLIACIALLAFNMYAYKHEVNSIQANYEKIAEDPIGWCRAVNTGQTDPWEYSKLNTTDYINLINPDEQPQ